MMYTVEKLMKMRAPAREKILSENPKLKEAWENRPQIKVVSEAEIRRQDGIYMKDKTKVHGTTGQSLTKITMGDGQTVAIRFDTYNDPYKNLVFAILVRAGLDANEIHSALTIKRGGREKIRDDAKEFLQSEYAKQMIDFLRS